MLRVLLFALVHAHAASPPQTRVSCAGLHTLCSLASCELAGAVASCSLQVVVNSTFVVSLAEIRNTSIAASTAQICTEARPCGLDQAPVCTVIADGAVFGGLHTQPGMVSAFSWDGWCAATTSTPTVCPASPWAACMTVPCTQQGGGHASCFCTWQNSSWLDFTGHGCDQVVSSVPSEIDMRIMPGAECAKVW